MTTPGLPAANGSAQAVPEQGPKPSATGERAMVSTSHPAVTAACLRVLREGGNAVDAMLTAMPLQAVIEPQMTTIAGAMVMLLYDAASQQYYYLNASLDHPAGLPPPEAGKVEETSGRRIGVPGFIAGMRAAAERFGTRPWASYFAPAIEAADSGIPMYSFLYGEMAASYNRLVYHPSGREHYTPNGLLPYVGQRWAQPTLATTLRRVAQRDGADWFQRGAFAEAFVKAVCDTGGHLTLAEMAAYQPRWLEPLRFAYRGHEIVSAPAPETGGIYLGLAMNILQHTDLASLGSWLETPRTLALLARTLQLVDGQVNTFTQDPDAYDIPTEVLLAPEYGRLLARLIDTSWPRVDLTPPNRPPAEPATTGADSNKTDSNHLVIADEQGNWATMLHSVYGSTFGTGLVVEGVSVNSGNGFRGVSVGPARRTVAPITPAFLARAGVPWLGIGTPSYPPPFVTLALLNYLDFGMDLPAAIDAPRFRLEQQSGAFSASPPKLAIETRVPRATLDGLARFGIETTPLGDYNWHVGSMQVVYRDQATGLLTGLADRRRGGAAGGY